MRPRLEGFPVEYGHSLDQYLKKFEFMVQNSRNRRENHPGPLVVRLAVMLLLFAAPVSASCDSDALALESNPVMIAAMDAYYQSRVLQNLTVGVSDGMFQFNTNSYNEAWLSSACANASAYYCSQGGGIDGTWTSNITRGHYEIEGYVSLCFPPSCCEEEVCDVDSPVGRWAFDELEVFMSRMCAVDTRFCYTPNIHAFQVELEEGCREVTLTEIIIMIGTMVGVAVGACCCFGVVCRNLVRRWRGQQAEDYFELHMPFNNHLNDIREELLTRHVTSYDSITDKDKRCDSCAICLDGWKPEDEVASFEPCGHLFHSNCIGEWLRHKSTCPVCRSEWPSSRSSWF